MKKFFSAFLLMAAVAFSVSTFVACNDVVGEIEDVKAQTTANAAAIESLKAEIAKLDTRLVAAQKAADDAMAAAVAAQETGDEALAEAQAAKAAAAQAEANAIAYTKEQLQALQTVFEAKVAEIETALAGKVDKTEFNAAIEQLNKDVKAAMDLITNNKKELDEKISALLSADEAINKKIDELNIFKTAAEALHIEITENIDSLATELAAAQAEIEEVWAAIYDEKNGLFALIGSNASAIQSNTELIEALQADLDEFYASVYGEGANSIMSILNSYYNLIQDLNEKYNALDLRVQSLVYVPEYSDHKATLDWAKIPVGRGAGTYPTVLAKATELKYLVKAEDAVKVAASIAEKPEVLDYVVKGVQTRSAEADLEIVNVEAEGEYIIVSVVAKNFDNEFYTNDEEGCYSAALVFDDETNTRTTEFTNLVASAHPVEFDMALFVPGEENTMRMAAEKEIINYLMVCNDYKTVKTAVKPVVGFVDIANATDPVSFYTVEYMTEELGYDVTVDMKINITDGAGFNQMRSYEINEDKMDDPKDTKLFDITETPKYSYNYKVQEGTTFDNVGTKGIVNYQFTCGDVTESLTYEFELANAQVAINAEVNVEWTVALQESLINNGVQYGKALPFEVKEFTTEGGAVTNLWSALSQVKKETKNYVMVDEAWVESKKIISNKKLTETEAIYQLAAEKYSWNNSYKVVFVTTNDELNVDYTTTIVVNLVGKPDVINVPAIDVDLLLNGKESFFRADVDLLGASYAEIEKYLGYADAAADKAAWAAEFENFKAQNVDPKCAKVNGKVGRASTLNELAEARLSIAEHNNGRYEILVDTTNVITFSAEAWFGVPFNFTVNADVVLPEVGLIYSEDYVKDQNTDPYAFAEAAIENGVYSIIKSDVAKYFNVAAESLEGHAYTVNFEVLSPEGDVVSLAMNSTTVEPKGASTYHYLAPGVDLDWKNYTGLEVNVKATLLVNGLALESRTLRIVAEDPLTLIVADFDVTRLHREDTFVNVYDHVVITSTEEPEKTNILTIADGNDFEATVKYAKDTYGVDLKLILDPQGVYYFDNSGNKVYVGSNKFKYENGVLTIYGDDSVVKNYYAEFTAVMSSRICKGEHRESFRITIKK